MIRALRRVLGAKGNWVKGNGLKGSGVKVMESTIKSKLN